MERKKKAGGIVTLLGTIYVALERTADWIGRSTLLDDAKGIPKKVVDAANAMNGVFDAIDYRMVTLILVLSFLALINWDTVQGAWGTVISKISTFRNKLNHAQSNSRSKEIAPSDRIAKQMRAAGKLELIVTVPTDIVEKAITPIEEKHYPHVLMKGKTNGFELSKIQLFGTEYELQDSLQHWIYLKIPFHVEKSDIPISLNAGESDQIAEKRRQEQQAAESVKLLESWADQLAQFVSIVDKNRSKRSTGSDVNVMDLLKESALTGSISDLVREMREAAKNLKKAPKKS